MKTIEDIENLVRFYKGYMVGQHQSLAPDRDKLQITKIKIDLLEYLLEYTVIVENEDEEDE